MTVAAARVPHLASRLINGILSVKPLADFAKHQARSMMIKRAESIGVYWREEVQALRSRKQATDFSADWDAELKQVENPNLAYPDYYLRSFHAYEEGNLGWQPAMEVEVAARAVHARLWNEGVNGDARLRQSYHDRLKVQIPVPTDILDLGCSVGMSTFALHDYYPNAQLTGVDLSPHFLAIAHYRSRQRQVPVCWIHAPAEATGLPDASFDLVSAFLLFHELPRTAAVSILHEARRVLRPGGHLAIMEMNPKSEIYAAMPPYILTLLKSTEPYLDDYFTFDIESAIEEAGFTHPTQACNSPRHRTL
ncbi:MAG TPA: class I SAM-dependent methyltransferase, partial [Elainellaceae cyanobacterium]